MNKDNKNENRELLIENRELQNENRELLIEESDSFYLESDMHPGLHSILDIKHSVDPLFIQNQAIAEAKRLISAYRAKYPDK